MLVVIKCAPDTPDGARGVTLARDAAADLVLLQNGVYFAQKDKLGAFPGAVYVLTDDARMRGVSDGELMKTAKVIDYDALVDLMLQHDQVVGMF